MSATSHAGIAAATATVIDTAVDAAVNFETAGSEYVVKTVVSDNGDHSNKVMTLAEEPNFKTATPERYMPLSRP